MKVDLAPVPPERVDVIAKAIFDWLTGEEVIDNRDRSQPPYTYNNDLEELCTGVDGWLDCKALATAIETKLREASCSQT